MRHRIVLTLLLCFVASAASAQTAPDGASAPGDAGRPSFRAARLTSPLRLDGVLDEAIYETLPAMSGFTQLEPRPGELATEQTEVWLTFDHDNIYVSARCWDSDLEHIVANELRRDNNAIFNGNDILSFDLDTFNDGRNAVSFTVNPLGGRNDGQVTNERQYSGDWNPLWQVKTGRFAGGWSLEAAIPFKSLRYKAGPDQIWRFNALRAKRSKNELSTLVKVPPARGQQAVHQVSLAAAVLGIEPPPSGRVLDLKPYAISSVATDRRLRPGGGNDFGKNAGFDVKYSLTQGLTGDFTYRTDFAQVEADEQQINLTRFSLFFPEKREFFLENQGTFGFGGIPISGNMAGLTDAPILFYSRRIGLNRNSQIPMQLGGRVTGRAGRYSIGVMNIQTDDEPVSQTTATNFSIVRVKRDLLRKSSIGVIATGRTVTAGQGSGGNTAFGVDGTFGFFDNLAVNTYWARTQTDALKGRDVSYRGQLDYSGDRYGLQLERMLVGDNFNPEIGFVRRDNMLRHIALARFSPRLQSPTVRKLSFTGSLTNTDNATAGTLESREWYGEGGFEFINSDKLLVGYSDLFEYLPRPFAIAPGVTLPVGPYDFNNLKVNYNMGQQHPYAANITAERGRFYSGDKSALTIARGKTKLTTRLSAEPTYTLTAVSLREGSFTTHLLGTRITYSMTPLMFTSALMQYSSSSRTLSVNARLRWEYAPGSELFVVYNDERDAAVTGFPRSMNRVFIVKVNRLFRF
jgi:hypothetical protein